MAGSPALSFQAVTEPTVSTSWLSEYLLPQLTRTGELPLARQLYLALRASILDGHLRKGQALPSSRVLAVELGLGRNTVLAALDQLIAEDYLATRPGSGTFVTAETPGPTRPRTAQSPPLAERARILLELPAFPRVAGANAFVPGLPEIAQFPHRAWQRLVLRHWRRATPRDHDYGSGGGHPTLKAAVASYLRLARAVDCRPEQILITAGTQQALDLCARLLADPGDTVVTEDPGYPGERAALLAAGLKVMPAAVDEEGMTLDAIPWEARVRMLYITPSHQYPSGAVMSLNRRRQLLAQAAARGCYVLEDDYDSEFRFESGPLASLQGLDAEGRVLYLGTFSKVMFPGLRLGYLVVPPELVAGFSRAQSLLYREGQYPLQAALAEFIDSGLFASHIKRMRQLYRERQALLRAALTRHRPDWRLSGGAAGMHLVAHLPDALPDSHLSRAAAEAGIVARALSAYAVEAVCNGLVLGYAGVPENAIEPAVASLARAADRLWTTKA